jgi:hypothetical protein
MFASFLNALSLRSLTFMMLISGAFLYLFRFAVKLPELLFHASIEDETLIELKTQLLDFLRYQLFTPSFMFNMSVFGLFLSLHYRNQESKRMNC